MSTPHIRRMRRRNERLKSRAIARQREGATIEATPVPARKPPTVNNKKEPQKKVIQPVPAKAIPKQKRQPALKQKPTPQKPALQSDYPVRWFHIENLKIRWEAPHFDANKQKRLFQRFSTFEAKLKTFDFSKSALEMRVKNVFDSIKSEGLINPLVVKLNDYTLEFLEENGIFVVVGNQRLTALKVLKEQSTDEEWEEINRHYPDPEGLGRVACRVCKEEDNWSDNTQLLKAWPQVKIEGFAR